MKSHYSVKEAARLIHVSTNTLYTYLDQRKIKSQRIGNGRFRIPASELEPYLQKEEKEKLKHRSFKFPKMLGVGLLLVITSVLTSVGVYYALYTHPEVLGIKTPSTQTPLPIPVPTTTEKPLETQTPVATVSAETFRFAFYNGTDKVGATASVEAQIKKLNPQVQVTARAVASKTDYQETVLVDLMGNRELDARALATSLQIPVAVLPVEEKTPENADFLIIVGLH